MRRQVWSIRSSNHRKHSCCWFSKSLTFRITWELLSCQSHPSSESAGCSPGGAFFKLHGWLWHWWLLPEGRTTPEPELVAPCPLSHPSPWHHPREDSTFWSLCGTVLVLLHVGLASSSARNGLSTGLDPNSAFSSFPNSPSLSLPWDVSVDKS